MVFSTPSAPQVRLLLPRCSSLHLTIKEVSCKRGLHFSLIKPSQIIMQNRAERREPAELCSCQKVWVWLATADPMSSPGLQVWQAVLEALAAGAEH